LSLRFNTENQSSPFWRVLADEVKRLVPSFISQDVLPDSRIKFYLTCFYNEPIWEGNVLTVR
jgi:hypothetical protein